MKYGQDQMNRSSTAQTRKDMKVLFLTIGAQTFASSRTRVYQYLPHLEERAIRATVITAEPNGLRELDSFLMRQSGIMRKLCELLYIMFAWSVSPWRVLCYVQAILLAPAYDIVYIQKLDLRADLYTWLRRRAKKIIYDIDDAVFLNEFRRKRVDEQIQTSDLTIVASEYLVAHVQTLNANVAVLPTPIDTDRYRPRPTISSDDPETRADPESRAITIGWIGSEPNTKYLELASPSLHELSLRFGKRIQFSFIGADPQQLSLRPINVYPWSLESELTHLHSFDIGIMPLPDSDEWAAGKAGYKLLQYMASGIPCVASPIGANKTIIRHGENGFLASGQSEWVHYLGQLIDSPALRHAMGTQGRKIAEESYSHRFLVHQLVDLLASVCQEAELKNAT